MHWIIQNNIFSERGWDSMVETLRRFDIPYSEHKIVPFVGELHPEPVLDGANAICIGSYSMRHAARRHGWFPGVFDLEPFDFRQQLEHWGADMLNHDAVITAFEDVVFTGDEMFLRPIHDSKHFAGRVFQREEFEKWREKVVILEEDAGLSLTRDTLVQACLPKKIYHEARFWIVDEEIVASSMYKLGSQVLHGPVTDSRLYEFARSKVSPGSADCWNPLRAFCLDVCDTPTGLKVVEINTLNSSGFYAADVEHLVLRLDETFTQ